MTSSSEQTTALNWFEDFYTSHLPMRAVEGSGVPCECGDRQEGESYARHLARVFSETYPAPRVVSTVAELDALPECSVIRTVGEGNDMAAYELCAGLWFETGMLDGLVSKRVHLPATVLWVGGTE